MSSLELTLRALKAAEKYRAHEIPQNEIAEMLGASQAQLSRILQAKAHHASRLFEEVCLYFEHRCCGITAVSVRANDEFISEIQSTWEGSASHSHTLASVIRSHAALGRPTQDRNPKDEEC